MRKGVLIAIEGTDGSGKKTQAVVLAEHLRKMGHKVEIFSFPKHGKASAYFTMQYLRGVYGGVRNVSSYQASLFFALDRFDSAPAILRALAMGKIVIADRYVGSNMGHQGANIASSVARKKYFSWVQNLEFNILGIPRPVISIVLCVPPATAQKLTTAKKELLAASLSHLQRAARVYSQIEDMFPKQFVSINCIRVGKLLSVKEVHGKIWQQVEQLIR